MSSWRNMFQKVNAVKLLFVINIVIQAYTEAMHLSRIDKKNKCSVLFPYLIWKFMESKY